MSKKNGGKKRPSSGTVDARIEVMRREGELYRLTHPPKTFPRPKPRRKKGP